MRLSKSEYHFRKNTAIGNLLIGVVACAIFIGKCYQVLIASQDFQQTYFFWLALGILSLIMWRWRENQLKNASIDE